MEMRAYHLMLLRNVIMKFGYDPQRRFGKNFIDVPILGGSKLREKVAGIYRKLLLNPESDITITNRLDEICFSCGENNGVKCMAYDDFEIFDGDYAAHFGVVIGRTYAAKDILKILDKNYPNSKP